MKIISAIIIAAVLAVTCLAQVQQTTATLQNQNVFVSPNFFTMGLDSGAVPFNSLPSISATGATFIRCSNCQQTDPCTANGSGAYALYLNGIWSCTSGMPYNPIIFQHNSIANSSQFLLNLVAQANITLTDLGGGAIGVASTGGGGGGSTLPGLPINSFQWNCATVFCGSIGLSFNPSTGVNPGTVNADNINQVVTVTADYNFSACAIGCTYLTSGLSSISVGPNTVTLSPVPIGVNGTDPIHYIQITPAAGDTSPTEWVLITGGTALSGAGSGTLTFTAAYSHLVNYTLQSATTGMQEAFETVNTGSLPGATVKLLAGVTYTCSAPVYINRGNVDFDGQWAIVLDASFNSCIVPGGQTWGQGTGGESQEVHNISFYPQQTNWSVQPTGAVTGGTSSLTATIPTCPGGLFAAMPNQLLWIAGTARGSPTTVLGYGEYAMTAAGGTCTPGLTNGTINLVPATTGLTTFGAHDNGYSISNGVVATIEDTLGNNGHFHDLRWLSGSGLIGTMINVNNDQALGIDNINMDAGSVTRKDADFQGSAIFAPGPFSTNAAVGAIGPNFNCAEPATCIRWYSGNDLHVFDSIIQNYSAGGIIASTKRGGFGQFTFGPGLHFEVGSITPPFGAGNLVGDPAIMVVGGVNKPILNLNPGTLSFQNANGSAYPVFAALAAQTATQYYYLVAHTNTTSNGCNSGGDCVSPPILIGAAVATDPSATPVTIKWYGWGANGSTLNPNPLSYDILRVASNSGSLNVNIPQVPTTTAALSVATGLLPSVVCSLQNICTFTDNVAPASLGSYTPVYLQSSNKRYSPIEGILPGYVSIGGDGSTDGFPAPLYVGPAVCLNSNGYLGATYAATFTSPGPITVVCPPTLAPIAVSNTATQCISATGVCGSSRSGFVSIAASATTITVASSAVTALSKFSMPVDVTTVGTLLGLPGGTCNGTTGRSYSITPNPGVGFTITASAAPTFTAACISFVFVD